MSEMAYNYREELEKHDVAAIEHDSKEKLLRDFVAARTQVMNADRFDLAVQT